jgi:hypothetical protein
MNFASLLPIVLGASLIPGCIGEDIEDESGESFTDSDGKADGLQLPAADVRGVLALINHATARSLNNNVGLSSRVAGNIATHRAGADGKLDTTDDDPFDTLAELDAVPFVGTVVLSSLVEYARAHGFVHDSGASLSCKDRSWNAEDVGLDDAAEQSWRACWLSETICYSGSIAGAVPVVAHLFDKLWSDERSLITIFAGTSEGTPITVDSAGADGEQQHLVKHCL